jgi:cytochrome c oxidase cbb3-type subunit 3
MTADDMTFTSGFWNIWIIVLTVGNILACWWLIRWTSKRRHNEAAEGEVTGHVWDQTLSEYNNPLPRWWLWMFYITLIFAVGYLALYPGLGIFKGVLNWSQESQYSQEMDKAANKYGPVFAQYASQPLADLTNNQDALRIGGRLYSNYCATCHGSDAKGASGFPNLADNDWLWGGSPEAIKTSILDGRNGVMPGWEAPLGEQGVNEVTAYVLSLSGRQGDAAVVEAGKARYDAFCGSCHGMDGTGNQALGAPNLTDDVWVYGGSEGAVRKTIAKGRNGIMPAHRDFLGEDKSHLLAAYVYSLSAGQ